MIRQCHSEQTAKEIEAHIEQGCKGQDGGGGKPELQSLCAKGRKGGKTAQKSHHQQQIKRARGGQKLG